MRIPPSSTYIAFLTRPRDASPSMEGAPKRRSRRIIVIVVAAVLVVAGAFAAWELLRSRSLAEVLAMGQWQAGSEVTLEGTITGIHREETSYGPVVSLGLDGTGPCTGENGPGAVLGDPNATYEVGMRYRTVLHFADYRFNGARAVSAPELACPMPALLQAVAVVWDSVSQLAGMRLAYNGTQAGGWTSYEVVTPFADAFRPDVLPVTLRKALPFTNGTIDSAARWTTATALEYVVVSAQFAPNLVVDAMTSLAAGVSRNGTLRYEDVNGNGLVDDGDRLDVRLPSLGASNAYETYMLQIGEAGGRMTAYAYGGHYVLNGPRGAVEPLPSAQRGFLELRYAGDRPGVPVTSDLEVARVPFGAAPPLSSLGFTLMLNGSSSLGDFGHPPVTTPEGVTIGYVDANVNGLIDASDRFTLANLPNRTSVVFQLTGAGEVLAQQSWTTGYGRLVGRMPSLMLNPQGKSPTTVALNVSFWHPELELNRTIRMSLYENGTQVLTDVPLVDGAPAAFAGGTLTFRDRDADGFLSTGDEFVLQGAAGAYYFLPVSVFGTDVGSAAILT